MFMIHDVDCGGEILGRILPLHASKNDPGYDWDSGVNVSHIVFHICSLIRKISVCLHYAFSDGDYGNFQGFVTFVSAV